MTQSHEAGKSRQYETLFEGAPVAMWEEDFTEVRAYLDQLTEVAPAGLDAYLKMHPEAVLECIRRVRILHVNRLAREFYGASTVDELQQNFSGLFDTETIDTFREEILAFASGRTSFDADITAVTLTGERRLARMNCAMLPAGDAPWSRVVVVFTDLTERERVERSLRESEERAQTYAATLQCANETLQKLNSDLERFAYAAAHDLREPLRTISLYTQLLEHSFAGELNSRTEVALGFIHEGVKRMERLILDLLSFAQILEMPRAVRNEPADPNAALSETLNVLAAAIGEASAEVAAEPLPPVAAESAHLRQLFQNLISNAIKYRDRSRQLRISVWARHAGSEVEFCVEDNGEGVRPEYHDRIFRMFQRLHGPEIQGSGIGLALCARIVELYGGRIWLESAAGEGSRFYFTLPSDRAADQTLEGS